MRLFMVTAAMLAAAPAIAAEDERIMLTAQGVFTVTMAPQPADGSGMARFTLQKSFTGDLAGSSSGLMLSAGDPGKGEAGYVALETVTAALGAHSGGFALQHSGTMSGGSQKLQIIVVPGSGSGGLAGISGRMTIRTAGREHFYTLSYALPATP